MKNAYKKPHIKILNVEYNKIFTSPTPIPCNDHTCEQDYTIEGLTQGQI